ncbi:MAG: nicotinic acid mononucleotide adenylyltransferase, partial [Sandarakinorhabdus sp.]|nr:nicotinic acid mononucleotide adenylyltransferase [Sandarakinorhabdus sp.]
DRVRDWTEWTLPAITVLDIRPTAVSATAIRAADPDWGKRLTRG